MAGCILFERDVGAYRLKLVRYAPHYRMDWHAHEESGVSIVLDGALAEDAVRGSATATAGWTVVKPAGTGHANRFGPMPVTLLAFTFRDGFEHAGHDGWRWVDHPTTYRAGLRLLRAVKHDAPADQHDALTDLLASLGESSPSPSPSSTRELAWLRTVRNALTEPGRCESVAALAARAGVHPVYLARRFRGAFGVSIREYRQIAQVRRATQLIVGTRYTLSDIAHRCGFSDHSHMCRSFRVVTGGNPAGLRSPSP